MGNISYIDIPDLNETFVRVFTGGTDHCIESVFLSINCDVNFKNEVECACKENIFKLHVICASV